MSVLNERQQKEILSLLAQEKYQSKFKYTPNPKRFISLLNHYLSVCSEQDTPINRVPLNDSEKDKLNEIIKTADKLAALLEEVDTTKMESLVRLKERFKPELLNVYRCETFTGESEMKRRIENRLGRYKHPANVVKSIKHISETVVHNYKKTTNSNSQLALDHKYRGTRTHSEEWQTKMWCVRQVCNDLFEGVKPTNNCKPTSLFYKLAEIVIADPDKDITRLISKFSIKKKATISS